MLLDSMISFILMKNIISLYSWAQKKYKIKLIFIYLKRSEILGCYTKYTKIYDIFCLVHESTYMELNKICFVIFRFFYELLHIYQFSANLKNKRKVNRTNTLHLGPCILVILNVFWYVLLIIRRFCIRNLRKLYIPFFPLHCADRPIRSRGWPDSETCRTEIRWQRNFHFL